jgi:S-adenosylmethionine/arginine decarboxylase-like enzyme
MDTDMNPPRKMLMLLPALLGLCLAGCIGSGADSGSTTAHIRMLNLSTGYPSIDLYTINSDDETDTRQLEAVTTGNMSDYRAIEADAYTLKFRKTGTSGNLFVSGGTLAGDVRVTYVAYGETNEFGMLALDDNIEKPNSGYTIAQVLNASSSRLDVYLTGPDEAMEDVSATVTGVAASATAQATVSSGSYRLRITGAGVKTDLRLDVPLISLSSASVLSIILTDAPGGVLVNAVLLPQQGQPTTYDNQESAAVRVLNVSRGYSSLDLLTNNSDDTGTDTARFTGITRGAASAYGALKAGTYTFKFRRSGASGNLAASAVTLNESAHVTYVAYGATNQFGLVRISDDIEVPDAGYTKVQVLNTTPGQNLDVYLTSPADALDDVLATVANAAPGVMAATKLLTSGNYRLRVTAPGSKTDIRLDVPLVTLASQGVVTLVLTDTVGGIPVGAVMLPQQAQPEVFDNVSARIRGAVGLASGSAVTVSINGTNILTRRPARSFIADSYTTLAAGNVPVTVYVDDVAVLAGTQPLQPGRDYTLLVTDSAGTPHITLVEDDNHIPPAGYARLRLLNGMSGLAAPLTLSVDYGPIAEYIDVGTASDFAELVQDTDYRLDLANAQTLAPLLTRESITLKDGGVYTFFAAGGGASVVVGTLRKDR